MNHVEFYYTLTPEEVYDGLRLSGVYKSTGLRAVIETLLFGVFGAVSIVYYAMKGDFFFLVLGIISLFLMAAVIIVPRLDMKSQSKKAQVKIRMRVYSDKLIAESGEEIKDISFRDPKATVRLVKNKTLVTAALKGHGLVVIPVRAIPKEFKGQVLTMLLQKELV